MDDKQYAIRPVCKCVYRIALPPTTHRLSFDNCGSRMSLSGWNLDDLVHKNGLVRVVFFFRHTINNNVIMPLRPGVFLTKAMELLPGASCRIV